VISQTVEYALRAVVCLAAEPDRPWTTLEIARRGRIPEGYLAKVMSALVRAQLVRSRRGVGGGFLLNQPPSALTPLAVVEALDPIRRIRACPLDLRSHRGALCPLHQRLDDAAARLEEALSGASLCELLAGSAGSHPLCVTTRSGEKRSTDPSRPAMSTRRRRRQP
jgi:Rrf2 family protein